MFPIKKVKYGRIKTDEMIEILKDKINEIVDYLNNEVFDEEHKEETK